MTAAPVLGIDVKRLRTVVMFVTVRSLGAKGFNVHVEVVALTPGQQGLHCGICDSAASAPVVIA